MCKYSNRTAATKRFVPDGHLKQASFIWHCRHGVSDAALPMQQNEGSLWFMIWVAFQGQLAMFRSTFDRPENCLGLDKSGGHSDISHLVLLDHNFGCLDEESCSDVSS
eukprot:s2539_g7.t1